MLIYKATFAYVGAGKLEYIVVCGRLTQIVFVETEHENVAIFIGNTQ